MEFKKSLKILFFSSIIMLTTQGCGNSKEYTVTFNTDGGSEIEPVKVKENGTLTKPENPTKQYYTFDNWYTDESKSVLFNFETKITQDITLFAKWNINNYTVTFDTDGGSAVEPQIVQANDVVKEPSIPTKEDAIFIGWYKDSARTEVYDFNTKVTSDMTIYAKFDSIDHLRVYTKLKKFKVGEKVNKNNFVVTAVFKSGFAEEITNYTTEDFDDEGNYLFTYEDIQKGGEFVGGKTFTFKYKQFEASTKILPSQKDDTGFSIQYVNLLTTDKIKHETTYTSTKTYTFESTSDKLEISTSTLSSTETKISYNIKNDSTVSKDEKIYIKVLDGSSVIDFFLIQFYDNSDGCLKFEYNDQNESSCYVYCTAEDPEVWDPSGIGSLLIPTYNEEGKPVTKIGTTIEKEGKEKEILGFAKCQEFTNIELPETLITINEEAFYNCSSLTGIYLPATLQYINELSFSDCISLTSVDFAKNISLTEIGDEAFYSCISLNSFTFPNSLIKIGDGCFYGCSCLEKLTVADNCKLIRVGKNAFNGVPDSIINQEDDAHYLIAYNEKGEANKYFALLYIENSEQITEFTTNENCCIVALKNGSKLKYLKKLNISDNVSAIASDSFYGCTSIENVNFNDTSKLLGIGEYAFGNKNSTTETNLAEITIPAETVYIGEGAFINANEKGKEKFSKATFKGPNNWITHDNSGQIISVDELDDPTKAASKLQTYTTYEWYK